MLVLVVIFDLSCFGFVSSELTDFRILSLFSSSESESESPESAVALFIFSFSEESVVVFNFSKRGQHFRENFRIFVSNFPEFFVFFGTKGEFISRKRKNLSFQRFSSVEKNIFEKFCWALSCGIGGGAGADRCDTDFWSSCSFSDPVEVDSLLTDSRDE